MGECTRVRIGMNEGVATSVGGVRWHSIVGTRSSDPASEPTATGPAGRRSVRQTGTGGLAFVHGLLAILLLGLAGTSVGTAMADSAGHDELGVRVRSAWLRAVPPGVAMTAGYARFDNTGGQAVEIVGMQSDAFERIEIHRTVVEDGISRMRPVTGLTLPDGQSVHLEPGGLHLMLMRPSRVLRPGDTVEIRFRLRRVPATEPAPVGTAIAEAGPAEAGPPVNGRSDPSGVDDQPDSIILAALFTVGQPAPDR